MCVCACVSHMFNLHFTFFDTQKSSGIGFMYLSIATTYTCHLKYKIFFSLKLQKKIVYYVIFPAIQFICLLITSESAHICALSFTLFSNKAHTFVLTSSTSLYSAHSRWCVRVSICVCLSFLFSQYKFCETMHKE